MNSLLIRGESHFGGVDSVSQRKGLSVLGFGCRGLTLLRLFPMQDKTIPALLAIEEDKAERECMHTG